MALFRKPVITKVGLNILSNTEIGNSSMQFTNIRVSDFQYPQDTNFELLERLEGIRQTIPIQSAEITNNENVRVIGVLSNDELEDGYFIRSIGFYVKDAVSNKEVLYAIINAENPDFFPQKKASEDAQRITIVGNITASNIKSATVQVDAQTVYTTQYEFNLLKESYNPQDVLEKLKTVDGHGSGLDADLLDGKHASSFILKNCTKVNSRQEIKESGLYFMSKTDATDLPIAGHEFIILVMKNNADINIIAVSTSDTDHMYTCSAHSNDSGKTFQWNVWKKSNDNADAQKLKGIVPIKSGGTGADNITEVLKNLKLKRDSIFGEPCSAMLNVGAFYASASTSMTMLEFATAMPLDTSVIFRTTTLGSPCISDAPTTFGEILFIKGSTANYMYTLYFDCSVEGKRDIYYWAASSTGIEKNWVKINDGGNADMVDGKHASEFATSAQGTKADNALPAASYTASDILTKLKTVDGANSGLDADLLDGKQCSDIQNYKNLTNKPNFQDILNNSPIVETKDISFNGMVEAAYSDILKVRIRAERSLTNELPNGTKVYYNYNGSSNSFIAVSVEGSQITAFYDEHFTPLYESGETVTFSATVNNKTIIQSSDFVMKSDYTPSDVLTKLKTVDGASSGLDADLLDGKQASEFATSAQGTKADNALPATSYTASDILTKLKTVDGVNSGLDADLLDGKQASAFATSAQGTKADNALPAASYTASDILTKLKTVDGASSGLDADLLDGKQASAFATSAQGTKADNALPATSYTASDILTKLKTVDGVSSGLDADLLDGKQLSEIQNYKNLTNKPTFQDILDNGNIVCITGEGEIFDKGENNEYLAIRTSANTSILPIGIPIYVNSYTVIVREVNKSYFKIDFDSYFYQNFGMNIRRTFEIKYGESLLTTDFIKISGGAFNGSIDMDYNDIKNVKELRANNIYEGNSLLSKTYLSKSTYNAKDILEKLKTVDGTSSGLDADLLDGKQASEFATSAQGTKADNALPATSYTASDILTKLKTVDGASSGLDADLLDGKQLLEIQNYKNLTNKPNFQDILNNSPITKVKVISFNGMVEAAYPDIFKVRIRADRLLTDELPSGTRVYYSFNGSRNSFVATSVEGSEIVTSYNENLAQLYESGETVTFSATVQSETIIQSSDFMMKSDYTASDVLAKLKSIDGTGSGLDADLLDGKQASAFATSAQGTKADNALPASSYTAGDILTKLKTVDGTGSGLDADLLDGKHASNFLTVSSGIVKVSKVIIGQTFIDVNGDAATIDNSNMRIGTWYGFGITSTYTDSATIPKDKNAFWVNARKGNTYTYSQFYANQGKDIVLNAGNKKDQGVPYYSATVPQNPLPTGHTVMIPE